MEWPDLYEVVPEDDVRVVTIDIQPEHFVSKDDTIVTEVSVDDEINILQEMDQREISRLIPEIHQQGMDYDTLKNSLTERASEQIPIPEVNDQMVEEFKDFFSNLNQQIVSIQGLPEEMLTEDKVKEILTASTIAINKKGN